MNTIQKTLPRLFIKETKTTPEVTLDSEAGIIKLTGRSMPSDSETFYSPIMEWISNYIHNPAPNTAVECYFKFYDTRSSKRLYEMMREISRIYFTGNKLSVKWLYDKDDSDSLELAQHMQKGLKIVIDKIELED